MQKCLLFTLLIIVILVIGSCHHHDHPPENPATTHLKNYLRLKKKSPDSALVELTQHAHLAFQAHPKAVEWAQLIARIDRAERASLPDILRLRRIELEMARDKNFPTKHLYMLEEQVLFWEEMKKELNAEGTDPHTFFTAFRLKIKK